VSFDLKIIAGDLRIDGGDLALVRGSDKLKQDLVKIVLTEVGSNPLQPWYGSLVSNNLIGSGLPMDIIINTAKSQLERSIETLKQLQTDQASKGQKLTPDEQISFIQGISVMQDSKNLQVLKINISVLTRAFGQVQTSFTV
jgi:phage baseplate assembly protein W